MLDIKKVLCITGSPREPPQTVQWAEWIAAAHLAQLDVLWITQWNSDAVLDHADRQDVDLIVVGAPNRGAASVPGVMSLAEEIVWKARCPVLAVCAGRQSGTPHVNRIVVPMDDSRHSDAALRHAKEIAAFAGAGLALFHALPARVHPDPEYPLEEEEMFDTAARRVGALRHLEERFERVAGSEVPAVFVVTEDHPTIGIVAFAQDQRADLIVMASHGDTGSRWAVIGSVTEGVVRRIPCPMLVVNAFGKQLVQPVLLPRRASYRAGLAAV